MTDKALTIAKAFSDAANSNVFDKCEGDILNLITDYFAEAHDDDSGSESDSEESENGLEEADDDKLFNKEHLNSEIACAVNCFQFNETDNGSDNETFTNYNDIHNTDTSDEISQIMKTIENISVNPDTDMEKEKISKFQCNCAASKAGNCFKDVDPELIYITRMDMQEMTDFEKNLIIIAKVSCTMQTSKLTNGKKHKPKERQHQSTAYLIEGTRVCREAFKFIHGISQNRLTACINWYKQNNLMPKVKKSGGRRKGSNFLSLKDIQNVVTFIINFAEDHALVLPGRIPSHKDFRIKLLPSSTTKAAVYRLYSAAMENTGDRAVKLTSFRKLWKSLLPYIIQAKPMTDLCWTCQKNNYQVYRSANLPEIVKSAKLRKQEEHLRVVELERKAYRNMTSASKDQLKSRALSLGPHPACSQDFTGHYSFDFAQQVHIPSDPLQPGPMYFLTPRKCGLFGINCEGLPQQVNYLLDEGSCSSKGSTAVISFLHHFFDNYALGEKNIDLHCDNCSGQNKNKYVLWYFAWRVLLGLHKSISLNFLISGHTKFSPDWCFGLIKQRFRKTRVCSVAEFADVVKNSTVSGINIPQPVLNDDGTVAVNTYDWGKKFLQYFKPLNGIKGYQHFRFSYERPGWVFYKEYFDTEEKEFCLLKDPDSFPPSSLPDIIPPPGLSLERQWYLFNSIREFCSEETQDVTCPKPDHELTAM